MAKENHSIEGIVHGGILSKYQKDNFSLICQKNDLEIIFHYGIKMLNLT